MPDPNAARLTRRSAARVSGHRLRVAARTLRAGGVVAHPTEGVWGLACDARDQRAVARILALKRRPRAKGLIVIADSGERLEAFVAARADTLWQRARASWPGPTTFLLPARADAPRWLTGAHATIALRQTAHALAAALCRAFGGALVSTSANVSGRPPVRSTWQARARFGRGVDFILAGTPDRPGVPSTIRDAASGALVRR